jgi:hypothetical protein
MRAHKVTFVTYHVNQLANLPFIQSHRCVNTLRTLDHLVRQFNFLSSGEMAK